MILEFIALSALALAIGGLIGLEREHGITKVILGVRTFALTSFLGFLLVFFSRGTPAAWFLVGIGFAGCFIASLYYYRCRVRASHYAHESLGLTTTLMIPFTFFLGALVGFAFFLEAGTAAIIAVYLLIKRREVKAFARRVSKQEILDLLAFAIIAFIIYPQLPVGEVDVLGYAFNVRYFWFIVVIVSSISFAAHVLSKYFKEHAVFYTALLGGMVSSLATMALFLKKTGDKRILFAAANASSLGSILSNLFLLFLINPLLLKMAFLALVLPTLFYVLLARYYAQTMSEHAVIPVEKKALSLSFAFEFAALFFAISLVLNYLSAAPINFFAFSFLSGLVSSTSVYAALSYGYAAGTIAPGVAVFALLLASIGSLSSKNILAALALRDKRASIQLTIIILASTVLGLAGLALSTL